MPASYEAFAIETDAHLATLWLNQPERLNAMGPAFWKELPLVMQELEANPEVRAIVLAAKGPHFTVGLDLKAMMGTFGGGDASASGAAARLRLLDEIAHFQHSINAVADMLNVSPRMVALVDCLDTGKHASEENQALCSLPRPGQWPLWEPVG